MDRAQPWRGPYFHGCILHITSGSIHHTGLVPTRKWVFLHEVMSPGIMVRITLIFQAFEHVAKDISLFQNIFLEFMLFALFEPKGGVIVSQLVGCPRQQVSTGWFLENSSSIPYHTDHFPYFFPPSPQPFGIFGCIDQRRYCTLPPGKKGLKVQRVKVADKR